MRLKYVILSIICLGLLCGGAVSLMGQIEFIDRSFGDNGTISFPNDTLESYSIIGADSLDNIYIKQNKTELTNGINTVKLIKLNQYGAILLNEKLLTDQDSISDISIINNTLVNTIFIGGSTIISTFDLEFNLINRFIIPTGIYKVHPTDDGGLEGLTNGSNNTFFKYNADGLLDKEFGENGLIPFQYDEGTTTTSFISLFDWTKKANGTMLFNGYSADSIYSPITKLYTKDGRAITSYGSNNYAEHKISNHHTYIFNWSLENEETKDGNNIIKCATFDSTFILKQYLIKINNDGSPVTSFGDDGYLMIPLPEDHIEYPFNSTREYLGQFNNGDLLHSCIRYSDTGYLISRHLKLHNEHGQEETNFGVNSKIELKELPGEYSSNIPTLINDDVYIIKTDTIRTIINTDNFQVRPRKTYITKLSGEKILDYEPLSPPENIEFKLFPNPVTDKFIIQYNGPNLENLTLSIYNFAGQLIKNESISKLFNYQQIPINLSDASPGIYPIQIINNETEIWSTRIIIIN